jgi:hypothetical protein
MGYFLYMEMNVCYLFDPVFEKLCKTARRGLVSKEKIHFSLD